MQILRSASAGLPDRGLWYEKRGLQKQENIKNS